MSVRDRESLSLDDLAPLPQRVYRVEHDRLGVLEIFPVAIPADRYEAVFT